MKIGLADYAGLDPVIAEAFRTLEQLIATGFGQQHKADGSHKVITADGLVAGAMAIPTSAVQTMTQLTANTDNYNPTGWPLARVIRLSSSIAINLTGWQAPNPDVAQALQVLNTGAQTITFKHASASSTAANQFRGTGLADVALTAGGGLDLWRDPALQVWWVRL